jgi:N-acetylmuramoyl-L-alanine amidase
MTAWSLLTAGAGWYALRDSLGHASAEDKVVATYNVAAPGETPFARELSGDEAVAASTEIGLALATPAPAPTSVVTGRQAVPRNVASAGVDRRAKPAGIVGPRQEQKEVRGTSRGIVVLDPGHGRGDPGAVHYLPDGSGRYDITEADSNLLGAELIRAELQAMGYEVYLTREGDGHGPGAPLPLQFITSDLYARVALAAAVDADVYLAIHGNGASVKSISGPETWYCGKHEEGAANEDLATRVQQAMMDALAEMDYAPPDRGIKEDADSHHSGGFCQFVVTRETAVPAALIEFLFLSNDRDAAALVDPRSHPLMAKRVAEAIDAFMKDRAAAAR